MSDTSAKQKIIDKIKDSTNILVTVSNNPSVDELSAALGFSLLLNKMKKHATAVYSGETPPAITFLDPEKTFEHTVDSLRDFIIALDKEKADHLRYKVEGDVVKIFITPYRNTITSEDLDFSQGDYNVEMVLALGVKSQDNLDAALSAHGKILADATVATITAGNDKSELGTLSWRDSSASSLSEMMVSLSEGLKVNKTLIDEQIATALLAGIVSATERFSNNRTSAKVMTMSAQLMSQGANQQLIASKFEEVEGVGEEPAVLTPPSEPEGNTDSLSADDRVKNQDGTTSLSEGESTKVDRSTTKEVAVPDKGADELTEGGSDGGSLHISHEKEGTLEEVGRQTASEQQAEAAEAARSRLDNHERSLAAEQEVLDTLPQVAAPVAPDLSPADINADIAATSEEIDAASQEAPRQEVAGSGKTWQKAEEPIYGGVLNATTHTAAEDARRAQADDRNKTILSHGSGYIADEPPRFSSPLNAMAKPPEDQPMVNLLTDPPAANNPQPAPPLQQPIAERDGPAVIPAGLPPLPDFSTLPPLPPAPGAPGVLPDIGNPQPDRLGDILPPPEQAAIAVPAAADDPGQFKIPGQG